MRSLSARETVDVLRLSLIAISLQAQRGVRIGYIDMEYILENVEEYQEASAQLNAKVQKWKIEIEQKKSKVEQMKKDLNAEKVREHRHCGASCYKQAAVTTCPISTF